MLWCNIRKSWRRVHQELTLQDSAMMETGDDSGLATRDSSGIHQTGSSATYFAGGSQETLKPSREKSRR